MHTHESIIDKVTRTLRTLEIHQGAKICVAHSGGSDSTCLLFLLARLAAEWRFTLISASLDHGLRPNGETAEDTDFVKKCAKTLGIDCYLNQVPYGEIEREARSTKRSIEEIAREKRYEFLDSVLDKTAAHFLATGHTHDDSLETVVMRFFQGPGLFGVDAIPPKRGRIIRPLIECRKEEIRSYLSVENIDFRTDSSNNELHFLRNRVRHTLLPVIRGIFPGFEGRITAYERRKRLASDFLRKKAGEELSWNRCADGYSVKIADFLNAHGYSRLFSIVEIYDRLISRTFKKRPERLPSRFLEVLLVDKKIVNEGIILRGHGVVLVKRGENLFCTADIVEHKKKGYLIAIGKRRLITLNFDRKNAIADSDNIPDKINGHEMAFEEHSLNSPVVIRSKRPGDKISVNGTLKSVKKLMNDWKVSETHRTLIPIIEDRNRILAIAGTCFGYSDRYADGLQRDFKKTDETIMMVFYKKEEA